MTSFLHSIIPIKEIQSLSQNPVDLKIRGVVFERISMGKNSLLPSASKVVIDLLTVTKSFQAKEDLFKGRERKRQKNFFIKRPPIGLKPVDSNGFINAMMQFILFVPGLSELFLFAPRSFVCFREFIDQYRSDQEGGAGLARVCGSVIYRSIQSILSQFSVLEVLNYLMQRLHARWKIHKTIDEALKNEGDGSIFVMDGEMKKQYFASLNRTYYDLDAFIELRSDGHLTNFVTYVKNEGVWYQCEDERITLLRSNYLNLPLSRAILLHYKRIANGVNL